MAIHYRLGETSLYANVKDIRAVVLQDSISKEKATIFSLPLVTGTEKFDELKGRLRNTVAGGPTFMGAQWYVRGSRVRVGNVELDYLALVEFEKFCKKVLARALKGKINLGYGIGDGMKDMLTASAVNFGDNLDVAPLLDELLASRMLTKHQIERIDLANNTRQAKVHELIRCIEKHSSREFEEFVHILLKRGFVTVVEKMLTDENEWFLRDWAL